MTFLHPVFLWGMLAGLIPVAIHLLQIRRPAKVFFTNTQIIEQVRLVAVRSQRVQKLVLLTLRVLGIVLLALAFAQPFFGNELVREGGLVEVVIDDSFSMQSAGERAESLLEEAKQGAQQLVGGSADAQQYKFNNSGGLRKRTVQDKIAQVRLGNGKRMNLSSMGSVRYLFSDFQKFSYGRDISEKAAIGDKTVLVPLRAVANANLYCDSVWVEDEFLRAGGEIALHVSVKNGGTAAAVEMPVKVYADNQQVAAFKVSVGAAQSVKQAVRLRLGDKMMLGRVVTGDAPVVFDNTYYFTLQAARAIKVLELGDKAVAQGAFSNEPVFRYGFARPATLDYGQLNAADLIILQEVNELGAGLRSAVSKAVKQGAVVAVVPSSGGVGRAGLERLFQELGVGMPQWEAENKAVELQAVALPDAREPFFEGVFGAQQRAVTMPRAAPVLRWARTGTDVLRLQDGSSYLAEFGVGKGRLFVFSAPFSAPFSDFTDHALFVPVMYRMGMVSYRSGQALAYRLATGGVRLNLSGAEAADGRESNNLRLVRGGMTVLPGQRVQGGEVRLDVPEAMDQPGFYRLERGRKVLTTLAFNASRKESELAAYTPEELRAAVGPGVRVLDASPDGRELARLLGSGKERALWPLLVGLVLVCLLGEAAVVRWGKGRSVAMQPR